MENLFRKRLIAGILALVITAGALPLAVGAQTATSTANVSCTQFQLNWTSNPPASASSTDTVGGKVSALFYSSDNPVRATAAPAVPTLPAGSSAAWQCVSTGGTLGSAETQSEKDLGQGMALCAKAAELAARFGSFTALNVDFKAKIQTMVLNNAVGFLRDTVFKGSNGVIDISNIPKTAFDAAGNFVKNKFGNQFDSLIGNPLKDEVNKGKQKIEEEGKKILSNLTQDFMKQGENMLGSLGIPGLGGETVPVKDEAAIKQQENIEKKIDAQIMEQKKAEVLADTRAKCAELLKTTNETIKRALLYQLSTQIVDWAQNGFSTDKTPQFIKQPGKFMEDTGRLALDRFISRVAPRLCEPFRLSVQLQIPSVRRQDNPFYEQITCSLDRVVANVNSFYRDFRQGGWIGYQEMLKPQNNYYGASLAMMDEAMKQQAAAQYAAQQEQARGFSAVKQCTEWARFDPYAGPMNSVLDIRDDGSGNYFLRAPNASPEATGGTGPIDADGNVVSGLTKEPQTGRIEKGVRFWKNMYSVGNSYFWECEADTITQPATVGASMTEKASQMDLDNLAASQDVSMFLQTIEDSIINKLTKSGVKGLQGLLKGLPISL